MSVLNKIFIKIFAKKVGIDQFGNEYYEDSAHRAKNRRYVIYKGKNEPSKVPPMWHSWLHHLSDDIDKVIEHKFSWQLGHLPNLTGTKQRFDPKNSFSLEPKINNIIWKPKKLKS